MKVNRLPILIVLLSCVYSFVDANEAVKCSIKLLDDSGVPLANVQIKAEVTTGWRPGSGFGKDLIQSRLASTDNEGVASFQLDRGNGKIRFSVDSTNSVYGMRWERRAEDAAKATEVVHGKSVKNPITMFVRDIGPSPPFWQRNLPTRTSPCGFDLVVGDWTAPYGTGKEVDLEFRYKEALRFQSLNKEFDVTLEVSTPGAGNGIIPATSIEPGPTNMPLPRMAPSEGYRSSLEFHLWRGESTSIHGSAKDPDDLNQGYFFRIRTRSGATGIIAARYGKILGSITFTPRSDGTTQLAFRYLLNPNEGDRNMEHKWGANLFMDCDSFGRQRTH